MRRQEALAAGGALLAAGIAGCGALRPFGPAGTAGRWQALASLGTPRDDFGFASDGKRLYAIGGMTGERGNALDSMEVYDPLANTWRRGTKLPLSLSSLRAVALGTRLLVAGGAHEDAEVAQAWLLDTAQGMDRWDAAAPLRAARLGHGMSVAGSAAFVAGGLAGGEPLASMEHYDAARNAWTSLAPLPSPRFNLALVAAGKRLYAIGGSGADRKPLASVDIYDLEQDRWQSGPALPQPLSNFGAALVGQQIHTVLHQWHFVLEAGNPEATWQRIVPMPTSRHGLGVAALGGALYAAGGCSEDPQRDLPTLEIYRGPT